MDILEELYKWKQSHTQEEWEFAWKETEYLMNFDDLGGIDYFIKYQEQTYARAKAIIELFKYATEQELNNMNNEK